MNKITLDAATARALAEAGPGVEVCGPDGLPLGVVEVYPPEVRERMAIRAAEPPPPGFATKEEYYRHLAATAPYVEYDPNGPTISHAEAMRRWGLE